MKQYNINVLLYILLLGIFSCEKQKTWEELTEKFSSAYEQQQFDEAEELARERLEVAEAEKVDTKEKNIRIATAMFDLGNTLFLQGKYTEALSEFQKELDFAEKVFGEASADVASTLGMIGFCYYRMEEFTPALSMTQQSLKIYKRLMPEDISLIKVPVYVRAQVLLGNIYGEINHLSDAEAHFSHIAPLIDSLSIITDPSMIDNVLSATVGLAAVYINREGSSDRYRQADTLLQKVWHYCEKTPMAYSDFLVGVMETSGQLHEKTGNYRKAEESYLNALTALNQIKGENNLKTASLIGKIGRIYTSLQEYKKADSLLQISLERFEQLGAEHSLSAARILYNVGTNYREMKEYDRAERALQNAMQIYENILGVNSPMVITILESLEEIYYRSGKEEKGIATRERINRIRGMRKSI